MIFICDQPREKLFEIDDLLDIESYPIDRQMTKLWDGNFCFFFLNLNFWICEKYKKAIEWTGQSRVAVATTGTQTD